MFELDAQHIRMGQQAADKDSALAMLGEALVQDGLVAPGYIDGLRAREAQGSTYLGQGIAIPHGTPQTRDQVFTTGVRIMQFPEGVSWGEGQTAYLAIAIAAKSDEHLRILQLLTRALGEKSLDEAIRRADSAEAIVQLLHGAPQELELDDQLVRLHVEVNDLEELAWQGARLLKQTQCVETGFAGALQTNVPLPLGDGLWWLHSDHSVTRPGLAFVTPEQPLTFEGQPLEGLFCLASLGEAHRDLLERLCELLIAGRGQELSHATSSRAVLEALGGEVAPDWPSARVVLPNAHGLHARPAKELARLAKASSGDIRVRVDEGAPVSAKSLSRLLALGARRGQVLEFLAEPGTDAEAALSDLVAAVEAGLGEEVEPISAASAAPLTATPVIETNILARGENTSPLTAGDTFSAIAAAPGLAVGPAYVIAEQRFDFAAEGEGVAVEMERLERALAAVRTEIDALITRSEAGPIRDIFLTHLEMLDDPDLREGVQLRMKRNASAAAAWSAQIDEAAAQQEALKDALLAERAADLRDVGRRVLGHICGVALASEPDEPYVLVMDEVGPGDVARLDRARVCGILTARGGASSHSAIVSRALGIPAVVGAGSRVLALAPKTALLVDGDHGHVEIAPDATRIEQVQVERQVRERQRKEAEARRFEPAITRDGKRIEVAANLGNTADAAAVVEQGAEAVGLLRTELVFMSHDAAPDEAQQERDYRRVLDALDGRPLVVRTLDVGGDKPLPYMPIPAEENPFLGIRGIRLTLRCPEVLETQLRALLRAADGRPLRIMFPMVGRVEEWRQARDILARLRQEIPVADLQVGIMIEVPSAALLAPVLAQEVDFFSVGTNDLTQYTLAIDRGHPLLSGEADGLHPSVLRLIDMTVQAAHAHGKWVGVCGELAADPLAVPLLLGLGVDELSVSARSVPLVKARVRELDFSTAQVCARQALGLASADDVRASVESL
ncbi:phosphocarrier protein FPr [Pseudomonas duriflava]|uniref:phosphoenolpyruvate--protein phosphotransferase n=1 Tax=Pseudomonas duriflava TaxID=459528 RepID=A0A562QCC3_9PSED|nr:phosphoenolpyruvate--protein phosphotransferase [Pseudomonas duriflava]TWI54363.1 phosphocarrier protein FPr [Pseudomonas duriflava]